jgi:polyphosphate kinase
MRLEQATSKCPPEIEELMSQTIQERPVTSAGLTWTDAAMDRDFSWLEFNRRVLQLALDPQTPLLERLKFIAIFTSNLDEFYMKRVDLLRRQASAGGATLALKQAPSRTKLAEIRRTVIAMLEEEAECFNRVLLPALAEHGIRLVEWGDLTEEQRSIANRFFMASVFPVLTPLAMDPGHPFPFLSNLSTSLGILLRQPGSEQLLFARVKVPNTLPEWVALEGSVHDGHYVYVHIHHIIRHNLHELFPGLEVVDATTFRVTRDAEVETGDSAGDSLREMVEEQIRQRRFEPVVRLELGRNPNPWVRDLLIQKFQLGEIDVYEMPGELDYSGLMAIASLPIPELRDEPWTPEVPALLKDEDADLFALIRAGDILVHHPYEDFDSSVERFIRDAANDPRVLAIKMTVYRVGDDTPFVRSLIKAAESGKQVACVIEIKARFDEARNLYWAEALDKVGAHVVYGVIGLKTHSKLALVVRQEPDGLRCYAHIGTGNYHVKTARIYADVGLFTCDPVLTTDVSYLFHFLTGHSRKDEFSKLLVAPMNMRRRFLELIEREIAHAAAGRPARIVAKMNQLEDPAMCEALCAASAAGVDIDLILRGFSCLRPGVTGLTDRLRIVSVIGRFLEHSRIYHFANGSTDPLDGDYFIGSADWMHRNLSERVEAIVPVEQRALKERLWEILNIALHDQRFAWDALSDGTYRQRTPSDDASDAEREGTHKTLMDLTRRRS